MADVGIFYGSDSGNMKEAAEMLYKEIGEDKADLYDVAKDVADKLEQYDKFIFASSTWGDGDLQSDWDDFIENIDNFDFSGKTVAIMGMGDQEGYEDTFCDCISLIHEKLDGANIVGYTSTQGYTYSHSESINDDDQFMGLALDMDNQDEMTEDRIKDWIKQISPHFGL